MKIMKHNLQDTFSYIKSHQLKIVTAESCTAGLIAAKLAELPGCGEWLECAFVVYSENSKLQCLNVSQKTIDRHGLTSEQVAQEMAERALNLSQANTAIATTGLAGPSNGDSKLPIGTICFAWAFANGDKIITLTETKKFDGERDEVMQRSAEYAIKNIQQHHAKSY